MLAEQAQDDAERSAIDAERTRIEAEFRQAMQSIPGLRAEVKGTTSLTDIDVRNRDTIESAVAYNMSLIDSLAATFSKYEKASDFYSRISTRGMMFHPQNGRLVTPQEYAQAVEDIEQREEDLAREEAERPFWDLVWHRVDPESLKADWPEAVKDFRARGLGQMFRPASKGGIAIDEIADELERRNLMPPGGGADALIEKLKEMSPPRRRRKPLRVLRRVSLNQNFSADEAQARLDRDVEAWKKTVDGIAAHGKAPSSPVLMLSQTPLVFQLLGTDTVTGKAAAEGGIYAAPHVFDGTHPNMTPEMWKQIPEAMTDPIAVFDSDSPAGRANGDLVFMLELQDANGATVVVPVALNARGRNKAHLNIVKSAYTKEQNGKPSSSWFVKQAQKNARYINGQKWTLWATAPGSNSPLGVHNVHGNTVYTEADLVNLKNQNPKLYQNAESVEAVRLQYEGTDAWMKAPNGQPTKLTEQQWLQVRTPEFKAWFGDWENDPANASKVVDENGEPLVVYHGGTGADISDGFTFDYKFIGRHASAEGYGFYFTSDKNIAQGYQDKGGFLIEGYLNIRKPMPLKQKKFSKNVLKKIIKAVVEKEIEQYPDEITDYRDGFLANYADTYSMSLDRCLNEAANILWENDTALDQVSELANTSGSKEFTLDAVHAVTGYDCFFANGYRDRGGEGGKIYVAWFPEQIKSTQNKGTFDPNNPNILYQDNRNRTGEGRQFHDNTAARQARGFVEIAKGHEYTIQLLQNANLSTLLHETGHIALSEMEHLMEMGLADDKLRADYQKIREYLGLKEGDNLSNLSDPRMVQANEKFAKAMELYLREGKAPSANLEGAFSRFKRWLMRIYKSVTDNPYFKGVTLNEDIRGVFDRLLANDAEIRRAAEKVGISARQIDKGRGMVEGQKSRLPSDGCCLLLKAPQGRSRPTAAGALSSHKRLIHDRA